VGLTDDQKAMLRLLAQREEGYEDIAALMGIGVEELRVRVKEALAEAEGDSAAVEPGQASEPAAEPAPAPEPPAPPQSPPADGPKAAEQVPAAPAAEPPPAAPAPAAARGRRGGSRIPRPSLPKDRGALVGLGAGALVVVVLVAILVLGGDGGSGSSAPSQGGTAAAADNPKLTQAILTPRGDGDASGRAVFGRFRKEVLLQVEAEGLAPSPAGETYAIWLYRSPNLVLRVGAVKVGEDGRIAVQLPVPGQVLAYVAGGAFDKVDVSLTSNSAYRAELAKARKQQRLPRYTGESVLRGEIVGPAIQQPNR